MSWRREQTTTYWPKVLLTIAALLPHSVGLLNRGPWGPKPSVWSWFLTLRASYLQLQLELQLTQVVCGTWLYKCLTLTCFMWAYASQYSCRSQEWCSLDSLQPSHYFQVLQSLYKSFGNCTKITCRTSFQLRNSTFRCYYDWFYILTCDE